MIRLTDYLGNTGDTKNMNNTNTAELTETINRIVNREVLTLANELVTELYKNEDLIDDLIPCLSDYVTCTECDGEGCDQCDHGEIYIEVCQHWLVSDWLADKLEDQGERVARVAGLQIWGRRTCGQGIGQDYVMQEIAKALLR